MPAPLVNPFGFVPTQNPYYTTVVSPAITSASKRQRSNAPTYADSTKAAKDNSRVTSGEWKNEPADIAKKRYEAKLERRNQFLNNEVYLNSPDTISDADIKKAQELQYDTRFTPVEELLKDTKVNKQLLETYRKNDQADSIFRNKILKNTNNDRVEQRFTAVPRQPFVFTCQKWINDGSIVNASTAFEQFYTNKGSSYIKPQDVGNENPNLGTKYIYCNVNPSQISWEFPLRAVDQMTLAGRVQHVWRSSHRTDSYFNEPVVRFSFQSGNIMPLKFIKSIVPKTRVYVDEKGKKQSINESYQIVMDEDPILPGGLANFYRFFDLMNQPKLISTNGTRQANLTYIFYNSRVFPQMVLTGMWDPQGLTFDESADNPNQVNWNASFTVYDSYPKFTDPVLMAKTYVDAGFGKLYGSPDKISKDAYKGNFNTSSFRNRAVAAAPMQNSK